MIYTIGHSKHSQEDFIRIVSEMDIIADVRSHPGSSSNPQFNREAMRKWLPDAEIEYQWWPDLGGWTEAYRKLLTSAEYEELVKLGIDLGSYEGRKFPKHRIAQNLDVPIDKPTWTNVGLRDYSYFMALRSFQEAVDELIKQSEKSKIAIMCSELHWWRCHRSMISDYLVYLGVDSQHIMPRFRKAGFASNKFVNHKDVLGNRLERYDSFVLTRWQKVAA